MIQGHGYRQKAGGTGSPLTRKPLAPQSRKKFRLQANSGRNKAHTRAGRIDAMKARRLRTRMSPFLVIGLLLLAGMGVQGRPRQGRKEHVHSLPA